MGELRGYIERAEAAWSDVQAAPLSVRKALLCAALIDDLAGRAFTAWHHDPELVFGTEDAPAFRRALRGASEAIGLIADLCGMRPDAPRLVAKAIALTAADYPLLAVEDYMVSVYNAGTVQRVVMVGPTGERLAHEVLADALQWWRDRIITTGA